MSVIVPKAAPATDTKAAPHAPAPPAAAAPSGGEPDARPPAVAAPGQPAALQGPGGFGIGPAVTGGERLAAFGQANTAAVLESGRIWFAGCHALSHEMASIGRAAFGRNLGLLASMAAVRSREDAVALHADTVRGMMDGATEGAARLAETSVRLAERSFAPLAARIDAVASLASVARG